MDLEAFFPYRLAVVAEQFSRALSGVYGRSYGLSREEWRLLFLLADTDGVSSLELSRRTTLDKVQVSRAARRLEEKGVIMRETSQADRRLRVYRCTDAGRALFRDALPQVEACGAQILDRMSSPDRAALEQGLRALHHAVRGSD